MKIYDITKMLHENMDVWPGDQPFLYDMTMQIYEGEAVNTGKVTMSTHTGTHLDAPKHYDDNGETIEEIPLEFLCGDCLVVEAGGNRIIDEALIDSIDTEGIQKILFKTTEDNKGHGYEHYPVFSKRAAEILREKGVHLAGTDAPSVDPLDSKTLDAHHAFRRAQILILEGLELHHIKAGKYELFALPLKLKNGDGAPVRAVLREPDRS